MWVPNALHVVIHDMLNNHNYFQSMWNCDRGNLIAIWDVFRLDYRFSMADGSECAMWMLALFRKMLSVQSLLVLWCVATVFGFVLHPRVPRRHNSITTVTKNRRWSRQQQFHAAMSFQTCHSSTGTGFQMHQLLSRIWDPTRRWLSPSSSKSGWYSLRWSKQHPLSLAARPDVSAGILLEHHLAPRGMWMPENVLCPPHRISKWAQNINRLKK